jgi:hypothetical protein
VEERYWQIAAHFYNICRNEGLPLFSSFALVGYSRSAADGVRTFEKFNDYLWAALATRLLQEGVPPGSILRMASASVDAQRNAMRDCIRRMGPEASQLVLQASCGYGAEGGKNKVFPEACATVNATINAMAQSVLQERNYCAAMEQLPEATCVVAILSAGRFDMTAALGTVQTQFRKKLTDAVLLFLLEAPGVCKDSGNVGANCKGILRGETLVANAVAVQLVVLHNESKMAVQAVKPAEVTSRYQNAVFRQPAALWDKLTQIRAVNSIPLFLLPKTELSQKSSAEAMVAQIHELQKVAQVAGVP